MAKKKIENFILASKNIISSLQEMEASRDGMSLGVNFYSQFLQVGGLRVKQEEAKIKYDELNAENFNPADRMTSSWLGLAERCVKYFDSQLSPRPLSDEERETLECKLRVLKASVEAIQKNKETDIYKARS